MSNLDVNIVSYDDYNKFKQAIAEIKQDDNVSYTIFLETNTNVHNNNFYKDEEHRVMINDHLHNQAYDILCELPSNHSRKYSVLKCKVNLYHCDIFFIVKAIFETEEEKTAYLLTKDTSTIQNEHRY